MSAVKLEDFPSRTFDKLRYGDTDRQGHVNNAVYGTFCETGRVAAFLDAGLPLQQERDFSVVLAHIGIDFRREVFWPGSVEIGTGITGFGRSSVSIRQAIFQNGNCVAEAESVIVLVDKATRRPAPVSDEVKQLLQKLMLRPALSQSDP